ncbi:MAG: 4-(cytidine 5'-diphospho)-2-C-methyl-D-erythritol kinase [Oscillospiraceae bacterium]|jgi:4-diphosphocytidyl-2-C-methyl-D-erythritol kinase|nr:4-(cytidine 5'-diphospho)-2-C-methyl-D-erythritol kinase [Oscillospiraceae bacterium]
MDNGITVNAYAKINLALDVLGRRDDGYHNLRMVMQSVSFCDILTLRKSRSGRHTITTEGGKCAGLPVGSRNLALLAAELFFARAGIQDVSLDITLDKRIPVCAGLGGGSSDAAAVLLALRGEFAPELPIETLLEWALELGSDVPFCVLGGTALAGGRGEALTPLPPLPPCHIVLCKPPVPVSTRKAFEMIDKVKISRRPDIAGLRAALSREDLPGAARYMYNVFEDTLTEKHRDIRAIHSALLDFGALGAVMSGTGPTVLGVFSDGQAARAARDELSKTFAETYLCESRASYKS